MVYGLKKVSYNTYIPIATNKVRTVILIRKSMHSYIDQKFASDDLTVVAVKDNKMSYYFLHRFTWWSTASATLEVDRRGWFGEKTPSDKRGWQCVGDGVDPLRYHNENQNALGTQWFEIASISWNRRLLDRIYRWAISTNLKVKAAKTDTVRFTRRYKIPSWKPSRLNELEL